MKSMAFPAMISMKLIHGQQHSAQTSYTKFHPNWTPGMETTGKISFTAHTSINPLNNITWKFSIANFIQID
jgi:hypothetical protein